MAAADETVRIAVEGALREVQPLPTMGRLGLGLAWATFALVIRAQAVVWAGSLTRLENLAAVEVAVWEDCHRLQAKAMRKALEERPWREATIGRIGGASARGRSLRLP